MFVNIYHQFKALKLKSVGDVYTLAKFKILGINLGLLIICDMLVMSLIHKNTTFTRGCNHNAVQCFAVDRN